ncbi:unnamed protein product [Caenorhabditis brenneri]
MNIVVILLFFVCKIDTVLSEFQIFRLNRELSACQIKADNSSTEDSSGSLLGESTEMCNLMKGKDSCVFVASHRKRKEGTDYQEHGCGECPIKTNHICNLIKDKYKEMKTICCCKSPNCLTSIYRDSEIGWKGIDSGSPCIAASYDSVREPRWIENQDARSMDEPVFTETCFISMKSSTYQDIRNLRNRTRLMLEMGHGCPFRMDNGKFKVSFHHDQTTHCCQGLLCNQELFRMIGFEWIQNTVVREEEKGFNFLIFILLYFTLLAEFFRRLNFEKSSYRYQNFFKNSEYLFSKSIFDLLRTEWILITILAASLIAFFCSPKNLDSLPPTKFVVKRHSKLKTELRSDDALVFGEL